MPLLPPALTVLHTALTYVQSMLIDNSSSGHPLVPVSYVLQDMIVFAYPVTYVRCRMDIRHERCPADCKLHTQ
jgi:hypothetical protein